VIADGTTVYALWYFQTFESTDGSVKLLSAHGDYSNPIAFPTPETMQSLYSRRPVYVVSPVKGYIPNFMLENYVYQPAGPLYRAVGKPDLKNQTQ